MIDPSDPDTAERGVTDWQAGVDERAARARELVSRLSALTATAHSEDRMVEVTVSSSGLLVGLVLDEGIRRRPAGRTAREILATLRAAQAAMTEAATAVTAETARIGHDRQADM